MNISLDMGRSAAYTRRGSIGQSRIPPFDGCNRSYSFFDYQRVCRSARPNCLANGSNRIPDILRHYANCIVAAEKEVFLATSE